MADWHERINLIVSGHKNLFYFFNAEREPLCAELWLKFEPFLTIFVVVIIKEFIHSPKHMFGMPEILIESNLFDYRLDKGGFISCVKLRLLSRSNVDLFIMLIWMFECILFNKFGLLHYFFIVLFAMMRLLVFVIILIDLLVFFLKKSSGLLSRDVILFERIYLVKVRRASVYIYLCVRLLSCFTNLFLRRRSFVWLFAFNELFFLHLLLVFGLVIFLQILFCKFLVGVVKLLIVRHFSFIACDFIADILNSFVDIIIIFILSFEGLLL